MSAVWVLFVIATTGGVHVEINTTLFKDEASCVAAASGIVDLPSDWRYVRITATCAPGAVLPQGSAS